MKTIITSLVLLTLVACASIPFNNQLQAGYDTVTAVSDTTDALLAANVITVTQAGQIEAEDATLKAALDQAGAAYAVNQATGGNELATALASLAALDATVVAYETNKTESK